MHVVNIPVSSLGEIRFRQGEHHRTQMHCTNWGGLVIQASVNWRERLDNRMY